MKIIQVISSLGNGGAEKFVVELSNTLSKKNTVLLCTFKTVESWMVLPDLLLKDIQLVSLNKKPGLDVSIYSKLYRLLKKEKPNIIHFHLDATLKYILPFVLLFPKIKFVHTLHSDLNKEKIKIFSQLSFFKTILKKVKLVCISANILNDFEKRFPKFKFYLVENGIEQIQPTNQLNQVKEEIEQFKLNNTTQVFVCVGRLDENKNQTLLMAVFEKLKSKNSIALIIGGDPTPGKNYLNKLIRLKPANVFILGVKNNISDYLKYADAFVMTSLNEGLPISVLEAFSAGLPVLATPAGGVKSLIKNNVNGFLSKNFSEEGMAEVFEIFLNLDKLKREEIKNNNISAFGIHYNINSCANKYELLYTS